MKSRLGLLLLVLLPQVGLLAQRAGSLGDSRQLAGFNYKEKVDHAGHDAKGIPLIIALHWSGSTPEEFAPYVTGFAKSVRILLVEGPHAHPRGGHSFYIRTPKNYYEMTADEKMENLLREGEKLSKFIEEATTLYAPSKKPVIIGASQGGDLSYVIAIRYGFLISRSFPLMATLDERIIKDNNPFPNAASIESYHGTADPIVPISTAKHHMKVLKAAGYKTKVHTYQGVKHDISDVMKADYIKQISRTLF